MLILSICVNQLTRAPLFRLDCDWAKERQKVGQICWREISEIDRYVILSNALTVVHMPTELISYVDRYAFWGSFPRAVSSASDKQYAECNDLNKLTVILSACIVFVMHEHSEVGYWVSWGAYASCLTSRRSFPHHLIIIGSWLKFEFGCPDVVNADRELLQRALRKYLTILPNAIGSWGIPLWVDKHEYCGWQVCSHVTSLGEV
jgi:hypothetical protein